jgi:hypothetical protein
VRGKFTWIKYISSLKKIPSILKEGRKERRNKELYNYFLIEINL